MDKFYKIFLIISGTSFQFNYENKYPNASLIIKNLRKTSDIFDLYSIGYLYYPIKYYIKLCHYPTSLGT